MVMFWFLPSPMTEIFALGNDGFGVLAGELLLGGEEGKPLVGPELFDVGPLDGELAGHGGP